MFGRLTIDAFIHNPIEYSVGVIIALVSIFLFGIMFYLKRWKWLWNEWLTSLDPKKIGFMYLIVVLLMLFKGVMDATMIRSQLALSVGSSHGFLETEHFQQIFTAHGTTMIFFVGMGAVFGMMNLIVPLQIGARDIAFPFLNSLSFWLFCVGAILLNVSMFVGVFSQTGWLAYPPLSGSEYSPGEGVDYWIWVLQISGIGSLLSGINFLVTILKMRCPGMTLMKMPLFIWCSLATVILVIFAFPILTATLALQTLDRYMGMHFFTSDGGGNPMMYINLIWAWGHPEVYILMLPVFGVFSEVVSTFSQKRLFGYVSMVWAIVAITFLSFVVWLHHFFTMGADGNVNAFFGIMTMLIAIPTGVKVFNWLFTMYGGRVKVAIPMLWFFAFVFTFTQGGMTGILMSIPPADFQVHNSLFLIAHFHSMVIGGTLFGIFCALTYWFPKFAGFELDDKLGRYAFWCWFIGFLFAFMPLYILGLMGATRRLDHYEYSTGWHPLYLVAAIAVPFIITGIILQNLQIYVSIKKWRELRDRSGNPWNGATLEWATSSPPPFYNFAILPVVDSHDPLWSKKEVEHEKPHYESFPMPKNSALGMYIGAFSFFFGFGLVWYMWWMAFLGLIGIIVCTIIRTSMEDVEYYVPVEEIERIEAKRRRYK